MNTIDDFEKVLKDTFVPLEDDRWLLDNGYMSHIKYSHLSMHNYMCYEVLRPFTFGNAVLKKGDKFRLYCDGAIGGF